MSQKKSKPLAAPIAEREPLSEPVCEMLEKVMELLYVAVKNPKAFRALYWSLYPRDQELTGAILFDDMNPIRREILMSRMFRVQLIEWEKTGRIHAENEREQWEKYRGHMVTIGEYDPLMSKMGDDPMPSKRQRKAYQEWTLRRYAELVRARPANIVPYTPGLDYESTVVDEEEE